MPGVFIFAGTTEGRRLAKRLGAAGIETVVSVATEYGALILEEAGLGKSVKVLRGRMTMQEMTSAIREAEPEIVVDATHPYALAASENIREAVKEAGVGYIRLKRKTRDAGKEKVFLFSDYSEVVNALKNTEGNILLTTGINTLPLFTAEDELRERLFVRVLPGEESLAACEAAGIRGRQIIAMQGPFSQEMNRATIHSYGIRHLVTKQSGRSGGFEEKVFAAQETGTSIYIVGAPEEEGISYAQVLDLLGERFSLDLRETVIVTISLVGIGPGDVNYLTQEAKTAIEEADVLFGSERMVEPFRELGKRVYPHYRGEDILPVMEDLLSEAREREPHVRAAVLQSGDSGFFSGASRLLFYLTNWRRKVLADSGRFTMQVKSVPGISSIQLLAARLQEHWDTAAVRSLHGEGEESFRDVVMMIPKEKRMFLLTSGASDVRRLLTWIRQQGDHRKRYSIYAGYRLSYPDEVVYAEEGEYPGIGAEELIKESFPDILPEGLYTVMIYNSEPEREEHKEKIEHQDTLGISNDEFLQEPGTPITKEEIRTIAISKLHITEPAVVYDIGSGTGSFAVELGRVLRNSRIFAIEKEKDRCDLIRRNVKHLKASSVSVVEGEAPDILFTLTPPTHAVIGGSEGRLLSILQTLFQLSPECHVVVTATTLETKAQITSLLSGQLSVDYELCDAEYLELNLSRSRQLGKYRSLKAENPVAILSFKFGRKPGA